MGKRITKESEEMLVLRMAALISGREPWHTEE